MAAQNVAAKSVAARVACQPRVRYGECDPQGGIRQLPGEGRPRTEARSTCLTRGVRSSGFR